MKQTVFVSKRQTDRVNGREIKITGSVDRFLASVLRLIL